MEPIDSSTKICTACRHCVAHPELLKEGEHRLDQYQCFHPNNILRYDPVDGSPVFNHPLCSYHRKQGCAMVSTCREIGSWFEPKPVVSSVVPTNPSGNIKQVLKIKVGTNLLEDLGL